ncbi:MAG: helix-turn-helix domain-containing protein [Chloroflexi bacterium]|nr:helix-turn-helix domain-containing protein [Chloroflexota bacterium]
MGDNSDEVDPTDLTEMLTSGEAASRLGVSRRRVLALVETGRLPARRAVPIELARLLEARRIKSVPAAGVVLIQTDDLLLVEDRQTGYPKGRPRKPVSDGLAS